MLSLVPSNDFIPALGDEFVIMTWQTGLSGVFDSVSVDPRFADHGTTLGVFYDDPQGPGTLSIRAVPEPSTSTMLANLGGDQSRFDHDDAGFAHRGRRWMRPEPNSASPAGFFRTCAREGAKSGILASPPYRSSYGW